MTDEPDPLNVGRTAMMLATGRIRDIQDDMSWERVRHLPVNRYMYYHADNETVANRSYREAERQSWLAARAREPKQVITFS